MGKSISDRRNNQRKVLRLENAGMLRRQTTRMAGGGNGETAYEESQ